jgi:hypothetical protein
VINETPVITNCKEDSLVGVKRRIKENITELTIANKNTVMTPYSTALPKFFDSSIGALSLQTFLSNCLVQAYS